MCPFCVGTAVWVAAGAVSAGGVSVLAVAKFWKAKRASADIDKGADDDNE
jgi:hypothetical protein